MSTVVYADQIVHERTSKEVLATRAVRASCLTKQGAGNRRQGRHCDHTLTYTIASTGSCAQPALSSKAASGSREQKTQEEL
eukprot:1139967-Pelagomonas_calceolata.AAC.6